MKKTTKTITFLLVMVMILVIIPQMTLPVSAAIPPSSDYLNVTKNDSFNKNDKFYMSFIIDNLQESGYIDGLLYGEYVMIDASLVNSSGKQITSWNRIKLSEGKRGNWDFGYDYSDLPSGEYTFILKITVVDKYDIYYYTWAYGITHTQTVPSFSYKSYEAYYDDNGRYMHKIKIQCKNMKGQKLYIKVYDEDGYLVHSNDGIERKTNDEVGWFAWDGYTNGVKNPSGDYTFVITSSANKKVVEKTLNLKIREAAAG